MNNKRKCLFSDSESDSEPNLIAAFKTPVKPQQDEEDTLDAFMTNLTEPSPTTTSKPQVLNQEIHFYPTVQFTHNDDDADSDEEVYRVAKLVDDQLQAKKGNKQKQETDSEEKFLLIESDRPSSFTPIIPSTFIPHPTIQSLTLEDLNSLKSHLGIKIKPYSYNTLQKVNPYLFSDSFQAMNLSSPLRAKISFEKPTAIQCAVIPIALAGMDVIGKAATGSGKTCAFVWPVVEFVERQGVGETPCALILSPTRELTQQTTKTLSQYISPQYAVQSLFGGQDKSESIKKLKNKRAPISVIVATPGRFMDIIRLKATSVERIGLVVIDEADRMFDLGFAPQLESIFNILNPSRQTLLFSATYPKKLNNLLLKHLRSPVEVSTLGQGLQVNKDVEQNIILLDTDTLKWDWLIQHLKIMVSQIHEKNLIMIFVNTKIGVDELTKNLKLHSGLSGVDFFGVHGDMDQSIRTQTINSVKRKSGVKVLVCTDVFSRGLDLENVAIVVNFDLGRDLQGYVHRVGRTGRAGVEGSSFTLLSKTSSDDMRLLPSIIEILEKNGVGVDREIKNFANCQKRGGKAHTPSIGSGANNVRVPSNQARLQNSSSEGLNKYMKMNFVKATTSKDYFKRKE